MRDRHLLKQKSIFIKTLIPILLMLFFIIITYTGFIRGYILKEMQENILDMYEEQTLNTKNTVETQLIDSLTTLNNGSTTLIEQIQEHIASQGAQVSDMGIDYELNQDILMQTTEVLIDLLKSSGASEVFLILEGRGSAESSQILPGIYIRNNEPKRYIASNSNLLFERGVPAISKKLKLPLDSYWKAGFFFEDEQEAPYYFKPLNAAKQEGNRNFKNLGYWHYGHILNENDLGVLSYSLPLVSEGGDVLGVVGIGINESHLLKNALHKDQGSNATRAYIIAKTTDGSRYQPYVIKGKFFSKATMLNQTIEMTGKKIKNIYFINMDIPNKVEVCLSEQKLDLYSENASLGGEQWSLMSIQNERELLSSFYIVKRMLRTMLIISAAVCFLGVLRVSRFISKPIRDMVSNLLKSDPYREINLRKPGIRELDELANSFSNLSTKVAEAHSRISTIIQMSDAGIAVFEYIPADKVVFTSPGFYEMLGIQRQGTYSEYVDADYFEEQIAHLLITDEACMEQIIPVEIDQKEKRHVKIIQKKDGDSILGVLSDVTESVLEKERIKHERNHDNLTGLLNRRAFEEKVNVLLQEEKSRKGAVLLMWDLDDLKNLNDTYGHVVGDDYLATFAQCLGEFDGPNTLSSRRSGDEFNTFIHGFEGEEEAERVIDAILESVSRAQITLDNDTFCKISVSMGKAWYPRDGENLDKLFVTADCAMYLAKNLKKRKNLHKIDPII